MIAVYQNWSSQCQLKRQHDRLIAFEAAIAPMASAMVPVLNVSRTGMFLGLDCNVALGIKFDFKMTFDGTETPVFGQAQVMWQRRKSGETIKPGVGIEILSFKDDGRSAYLRFLEDCFMVLTVSDLMHENIVTVPPSATVAATVEAMCKADVGSAMIIDDHGGPLGIFTERDMLKHATRCDIHRDSVATLMTTELRTISSNASTDDAYQTLRGRKFRHLPVVDSGKLMGTLSTRDLFSYWSELIELYSTRVARDYNHAMGFI
ncbi:MAG: CBS domain-containing protein, partial [Proteobacteria bacterium]|nr:CBS domain-containing protein [Pseudomonadota bacterium]